jgi:hypothetical protein
MTISFDSAELLASAMRRAELAHGEYEQALGHRDDDWPIWYATYMEREQRAT